MKLTGYCMKVVIIEVEAVIVELSQTSASIRNNNIR